MSNKVYIGIIAALLGAVGYLAFNLNKKEKEIVYINQEKGTVMDERAGLEVELQAMRMSYDTLSTDNEELLAQANEQKAQIDALIKKVRNKDFNISKLQAEAETLRTIMKGYIHTIDSLNVANEQLAIEKGQAIDRAVTAENRGTQLEGELNTKNEMLSKGSILSTGEFANTGIKERNTGKQVETDRAGRTESIKSCFTVRKNAIVKPGVKAIYMSVVGPDGKVLTGKSAGTVKVGGVDTQFSVTREVDYQQQDVDVCLFYQAIEGYEFKKGNYKIFIYEGGNIIGQSDMALK
jgi:hypothetical protein